MRTKIGKQTKPAPKVWTEKIPYSRDLTDDEEQNRKNHNELLLNRRPYFFSHLYRDSRNDFRDYQEKQSVQSRILFDIELKDLLSKGDKTVDEQEFCDNYYERSPVIITNSTMNRICYYIEDFNFNLKDKLKTSHIDFDYQVYKNHEVEYKATEKRKIIKGYNDFREYKKKKLLGNGAESDLSAVEYSLADFLEEICNNTQVVVSVLVDYLYCEKPKSSKAELWNNYGKILFKNVLDNNKNPIYFPFKDDKGAIEYLGHKYSRKEVSLWQN